MYSSKNPISERWLLCACIAVASLMAVALLLIGHSAMGFSDPNHWIRRTVALMEGDPELRRVILFPLYVSLVLRWVGTSLVFLCNLPFLMLLMGMCGWLTLRVVTFRRELDGPWKALAFVSGAVGLMYYQSVAMSVMLNPYRDAPGMALCLLGWFLFLRGDARKSLGWGFLAGLVCALSLGFRETMILAYLPVGVWTLVRLFRNRRHGRVWAWAGMMLLGGIIGLLPTFYQNHLYSGYFFIPAYSARLIVQQAEEVDEAESADPGEREAADNAEAEGADEAVSTPIPRHQMERRWMTDGPTRLRFHPTRLVPGASPGYFQETSRRIVQRFWRSYKGIPGILFLLTLGVALVKRNPVVLGLVLPSLVITFFFYGAYHYVNWRYVFFIHVCFVPMIAAGLVEALWGLGRLRANMRPGVGLVSLVLITLLFSGWSSRRIFEMPDNRIYAWDIPKFRELITPHLEEPRTFIGFYHHREMLSWFVDEDFNHSSIGSHVYPDTLRAEGLDAALQRSADEVWTALEEGNLYLHHMHHLPVLLPLWTETRPVVHLGELPVRLYRYGQPLDHMLYQIVPWQRRESTFTADFGEDAEVPKVLVVNPRRLWDDPQRNGAELWLDDQKIVERLDNGAQFIELPAGVSGEIEVRVSSDAPVPAEIPHEIWTRNETFLLPFGMRRDWWFTDAISQSVQAFTNLRGDACMLINTGSFRFPVFAEADREVYVELRVEFVQESRYFREGHYMLEVGDGPLTRGFVLAGHRQQRRMVVPLGPGTGKLDFREISVRTNIPGWDEQVQMISANVTDRIGFLKIFDARIFTLPKKGPSPSFELIVGDAPYGIHLLGGVHGSEMHLGRYPVRWTDGRARILLPEGLPSDTPGTLEITYFDHRPDTVPAEVSLRLGGMALPEVSEHVETETRRHTLSVDLDALPKDGPRVLEIVSSPWQPFRIREELLDTRQLGVMLHQVRWTPEGSDE